MTCTDGIYIDDRRIDDGDCSGPQSARTVLMNPGVDAAVFETARGGILREGLGFDRCDVAVVTNIGDGDHLGLVRHRHASKKLAKVKRCIVEAVPPERHAVLNAADPLVAGHGPLLPRQRDCSSPSIRQHPVIVEHREARRPGRLRPRPRRRSGRRRPGRAAAVVGARSR